MDRTIPAEHVQETKKSWDEKTPDNMNRTLEDGCAMDNAHTQLCPCNPPPPQVKSTSSFRSLFQIQSM